MNETAPTSTGEAATAMQPKPTRKPALPALTGLRTLLALVILLFHFTPAGLRWEQHPWVSLYPIIDIGYVFVSFFFLISGFILAYNYGSEGSGVRVRRLNALDFWMARLSRLYPVYALTMLISVPMLIVEWTARPHAQFYEGILATPLLLQGFDPELATFWMTVTWTLSCEVVLYLLFPWLLRVRMPRGAAWLSAMVLGFWILGLVPHTLYLFTNPDHLQQIADRYSKGFWIDTLKYTPLPYLFTFLAGLTLGRLHEALALSARVRAWVGLGGFVAAGVLVYGYTDHMPYILVHGGLLTPVFAAIILGLAGPSWLASIFSIRPLVFVGASTYALYLLHFNVFLLLQKYKVWQLLHMAQFDPWISYVFIILVALGVRQWVEHPAQVAISGWWKARRAAQPERPLVAAD